MRGIWKVTHVLKAQSTGGARRDRTDDLMLAKHALSQLSYGPLGKAQGAMLSYSLVASSAGGDVRHLGCRGISRDGRSALRTFGPDATTLAPRRQSLRKPKRRRRQCAEPKDKDGGPGTTRTSDLTLIRGAL